MDSTTVTAYVADASELWRPTLTALRTACLAQLTGFHESMRYGGPAYSRDGVAEVGWAVHKQYTTLYVLRTDVLGSHRERLTGLSVGKGAVRYRRPDQVDMQTVESMLRATATARGPVC